MFDIPIDDQLRAGEVLAGRYRVERHLASGGFGDLWLAEQIALGRTVAVKVLRPDVALQDETVRRFQREARTACRVSHPHLVVYHDFGADADGRLFLVMEYIEGRSLAEILDETPQLPLGRVLHVLVQVCDALQAAHDAGVVHRDLKPANVMLAPQSGDPDYVKVIDFGILKDIGGRGGSARRGEAGDLTHPDEILGTPEYLAPEIIRGDPFDGRVDQYAAGVLLYELLTGRRPFAGPSALAVLEAQVKDDVAPLGGRAEGRAIPPVLESVLRRAMAKQPDERFASMADLAAALRTVARTYTAGPQAETTLRPADRRDDAPTDLPTVIDFLGPAGPGGSGDDGGGDDGGGIDGGGETLSLPIEGAAAPAPPRRAWLPLAIVALMAAAGALVAYLST